MTPFIPADWQAFVNFLLNPATMSVVLTVFISHIHFFKNPDRDNLVKFLLAVLISIVWGIMVTLVKNGAFPDSAPGWYSAVYVGIALAVGNQLVWLTAEAVPGLGDFLVALFGKSTTQTTSNIEIKANTQTSGAPTVPQTVAVKGSQ